jgi:hypothetical protein
LHLPFNLLSTFAPFAHTPDLGDTGLWTSRS